MRALSGDAFAGPIPIRGSSDHWIVEKKSGASLSLRIVCASTSGDINNAYYGARSAISILDITQNGLTQGAVDARIDALVADWAQAGSTETLPAAKLGDDTVEPGVLVADSDTEKEAMRARIGAVLASTEDPLLSVSGTQNVSVTGTGGASLGASAIFAFADSTKSGTDDGTFFELSSNGQAIVIKEPGEYLVRYDFSSEQRFTSSAPNRALAPPSLSGLSVPSLAISGTPTEANVNAELTKIQTFLTSLNTQYNKLRTGTNNWALRFRDLQRWTLTSTVRGFLMRNNNFAASPNNWVWPTGEGTGARSINPTQGGTAGAEVALSVSAAQATARVGIQLRFFRWADAAVSAQSQGYVFGPDTRLLIYRLPKVYTIG